MSSRVGQTANGQPSFQLHSVGAYFVLLLVFATTSAALPSPQQQSNSNARTRISGTVLNCATRDPIAHALVSNTNRLGVLTDGEGHFEFNLPEDSSSGTPYWLQARKPGFLDDPHGKSNVEVVPGGEASICLLPEAIVKGRVMLSTAEPASGITLQIFFKQLQNGIYRWIQEGQVRANSNGEFRFAELRPGAYKLFTHEFMDNDPITSIPGSQAFGFPPIYYPNASDFGATGAIELAAGQTFQADISLIRQSYYPVKIPVANSGESNGLTITVTPRANRSPGYSLGYNRTRQAIEGSLPNGNYLVEAASFGQNPTFGAINLAVAGVPAEGAPMALGPGSSITLRVKEEFTNDGSNSNIGVTVFNGTLSSQSRGPAYLSANAEAVDDFEPRSSGRLRQPTSPNDDSMVIEGLRSGRYRLQFYPSRGYVASATMNGADVLHQPIAVGSGSNVTVDVVMRDDVAGLEVTVGGLGTVSAASPGGTNGITAQLYCVPLADSPGRFQQIGVGSDGKVSLAGIAPGTYRVMALRSRDENIPYGDPEAMRAYETKGQIVHLPAGQKTTIQLQVSDNE
jgi:hypothetical protein